MKMTMKRFQTYLMVLWALSLTCFVATSCSDDETAAPETIIPENLLANGMTFAKDGGTLALNIKSNVALEVTSSAPDWCTVTSLPSTSTTVSKYSVTTTANTQTDDRTATITVKAGGVEAGTISVKQTAADGLVVASTTLPDEVPAAGGSYTVTLSTNGDVEVETDVNWITTTETRAMTERTVSFSVAANLLTAREGHITFTLGTLVETVTVKQAAGEAGDMSSDAKTLAKKMYAGVNIGNTMEVPGGETGWGNPAVSKTYVDGLKAMGFNAVRIPCAWNSHLVEGTTTNEIDPDWLERVSEVVGYCVSNDMYAIVNIHWDGGWLEDHILGGYNEEIDQKQKALWTQIATKLNGYDEHLLFAGTNEPGMNETSSTDGVFKDPEDIRTIMRYEQTFVDAVRATGGNNATRCLIVQAPGTRIDDAVSGTYAMPTDVVADRLLVEVHFYEPYNFCQMGEDASWGYTAWYWGEKNHISGSDHNAGWGEEDYVTERFATMKEAFVDKGYPVIVGEYAAMKRTKDEYPDIDEQAHNNSRAYWNEVVTREAKNHGCVPFYWETGTDVNRNTGAVREDYAIEGIMKGAEAGVYPF